MEKSSPFISYPSLIVSKICLNHAKVKPSLQNLPNQLDAFSNSEKENKNPQYYFLSVFSIILRSQLGSPQGRWLYCVCPCSLLTKANLTQELKNVYSLVILHKEEKDTNAIIQFSGNIVHIAGKLSSFNSSSLQEDTIPYKEEITNEILDLSY